MAQQKSAFDTPWFNRQDKDFFNMLNQTKTPHVILTAETDDFDEETTQLWRDEGFNVAYEPLLNGGNEYIQRVHTTGDGFGSSEYYAVVAFGDAASLILQAHTEPAHPKLCAIVAYYPPTMPATTTKFPHSFKLLVHIAGTEVDVLHHPQVVGIQGKPKTTCKKVEPGAGYGEGVEAEFPAYTYVGVAPGFAERDLDDYDAVAEAVAFTRSVTTVRRGFRIDPGIEAVRDELVDLTAAGQTAKAVKRMREYAHVIHGPTLTGGVGTTQLKKFYSGFFQPLPPSFRARLLSRTIGSDRVVDELFVTFTHSQEIAWILPGVPATGKRVEVVMVSIVHLVGKELESEHVYWDQASVLVQVGLLSPRNVPEAMREKGVDELPIMGAEAARAVRRGGSKRLNEMILEWE
ncbi:hypothetical protein LTR08_008579 [Meristemomyces frigidus]|nr:hypothetical protein LTR08_008579 [Meristemomyces frigidus]